MLILDEQLEQPQKPTPVHSSSPSVTQTYVESSFQPTQNMRESSSPSRVTLSVGYSQSALIASNGELNVWGNNLEGQLLNDFNENIQRPTILSDDVKNIKFGSLHSCIMHIYLKVCEEEETEKTNGAKGKTVGCVMKIGCC